MSGHGGPGYERLPRSSVLNVGRASVPVIFKGGRHCPPSPRRRPESGKRRQVPGLRREDGSGCATLFGKRSTKGLSQNRPIISTGFSGEWCSHGGRRQAFSVVHSPASHSGDSFASIPGNHIRCIRPKCLRHLLACAGFSTTATPSLVRFSSPRS